MQKWRYLIACRLHQFLIKEFREQPFANKIHSFWALAYLGGDDVREEFKKVFEDDHRLQSLHVEEMRSIESIAIGFGYLAKEDPLAYNYLIKHCKPDDWIGLRKYEIDDVKKDLNGIIASVMIVGIGISGHEDAQKILDNVTNWDGKSLRLVDSSLVEAYAYLNQDHTMSRKESVLYNVNLDRVEHFMSWTKTDEGRKLFNWNRARIHLPPL